MWGWKTVERLIEPSVSFDEAKQLLQQHGFRLHASHPAYAVFQRPGTQLTLKGKNMPLDLALAQSHSGLSLQLRYGTFCLFDTGDLGQVADEIAHLLIRVELPADQVALTDGPSISS
jgi:hypothetical protein